jgi:hypothetical protein
MSSATIHSCTNPQRTHIENKRGHLGRIWKTPEWLKESAAYKARHFPVCSRCFRVAHIVPGHSGEDYLPGNMRFYIDRVRKDQVVPLCHQCNKEESKGKHPCPSCIDKHREDPDHWIRYIGQGEELCWPCEHGEGRRKQYRNPHACDWHGRGQGCGNPLRHDKVCPHSSRTAADRCDPEHFMERRREAVHG